MASPKTIQSTQPFTDPQNNVVANGILVLDLSQVAMVTSGGGEVAPTRVAITLTAGGVIPASTLIWANDQLSPSGTTYHARLINSNLDQIADFGQWNIAGSSPIDVSQIIPSSSSGGANAPLAVLQQPAAAQVINGFSLTMEGALLGFSPSNVISPDTGISRDSAGVIDIGNGTQGDKSGTLNVSAISTLNTLGLTTTGVLKWSTDTGLSRDAAGVIDIGNGTQGDKTGTLNATIINALTGFRVSGAATSGNVLRGNGTNFVNATLGAVDLSNGVTGSGAVVLAVSPVMTGTTQVGKLQANTGIANAAGLQYLIAQPSCTTLAVANSACGTTVTWPIAFADTSYGVVCSINALLSGGSTIITGTGTRSTTQSVIEIQNTGANTAASQISFDCIAWHP